jgi:hypothetical protein
MRTDGRLRWSAISGLLVVGLIAIAGAVVLVGGSDSSPEHSRGSRATVISHLHARYDASAGARPFNSLDDLLDNVRFSMPGRQTRPMTDAVVVGKVTEVSKGMGFYVEGNDGATGIETDFDDPRVEWRTVHLTLAVERTLSGSNETPVTVGFAFGNAIPFDQIRHDFLSYERVLLFLQKGQPVFDYNPNVYGTIMDGALLGLVGSDGSISLPVLGDGAAELMKNTQSVDALARARQARPRLIELDASGVIVGGEPD